MSFYPVTGIWAAKKAAEIVGDSGSGSGGGSGGGIIYIDMDEIGIPVISMMFSALTSGVKEQEIDGETLFQLCKGALDKRDTPVLIASGLVNVAIVPNGWRFDTDATNDPIEIFCSVLVEAYSTPYNVYCIFTRAAGNTYAKIIVKTIT